jgi:hypothetical protein
VKTDVAYAACLCRLGCNVFFFNRVAGAGAEAVEVFRDSKLVISQLTEEYRCESKSLFPL